MKKSSSAGPALVMSLMPSIFAAGCCATTPLMLMFGFSLGEHVLLEYTWHFRLIGLLLLGLSLLWYFRKQGVRTYKDIQQQRTMIIVITLQTLLYSLAIYVFLLRVATPAIYQQVLGQMSTCCGL